MAMSSTQSKASKEFTAAMEAPFSTFPRHQWCRLKMLGGTSLRIRLLYGGHCRRYSCLLKLERAAKKTATKMVREPLRSSRERHVQRPEYVEITSTRLSFRGRCCTTRSEDTVGRCLAAALLPMWLDEANALN